MASAPSNYYTVLGLPKNADAKVIRKAYRKLAIKWHPDKNQDKKEAASAMFKKIAEAYDVLSDPEKKKLYDLYGEQGLKGGPPPGTQGGVNFGGDGMPAGMKYQFNGDPMGMFAEMMGGRFKRQNSYEKDSGVPFDGMFSPGLFGGMGGMAGPPRSRPKTEQPKVVVNLPISLEFLYKGGKKGLKITRKNLTMKRPTVDRLEVPVKAGMKPGTKVTFKGAGDEVSPGISQDIQFVIQDKKHPVFRREGKDLHMHRKIDLVDALTGFNVNFKALDGKKMTIPIKEVVGPGCTKVVSSMGMPSSKNPSKKGNLVITFEVVYPKELSPGQKETLRRIMPRTMHS